jgi:hypothetical protein
MTAEIEAMCAQAGLLFEEVVDEVEPGERVFFGWTVRSPGSTLCARLLDPEDIASAVSSRFVDWRPLPDFNAMFQPVGGGIEAEIDVRYSRFTDRNPLGQLMRSLGADSLPVKLPATSDGIEVTVGLASPELMFWRTASPSLPSINDEPVPSLTIRGLRPEIDPSSALLSIGSAALWSIWRATNVAARLRRHATTFHAFMLGPPLFKPELPLAAPTTGPDSAAFELFVSGLLKEFAQDRYIAFYRVLEFFFTRSMRHGLQRKIRRAGDGAALSDEALFSILQHVELKFQEKEAFGSVLSDVFPADSLFELVQSRIELRKLYIDRLAFKRDGFIRRVADSLYETRCSVVHARESRKFILPTEEVDVELHLRLLTIAAERALRHFSAPRLNGTG